jgi:circadian clock protein KaiC
MTDENTDLIKTGIPGLDEVLLGGIRKKNTVLLEGAAGTGKTTLGLGWIHAGAAQHEEPGMIVSFELDQEKILRDAAGFDWDLKALIDAGQVKIIQTTPAVLMEELQSDDSVLAADIKKRGVRRLMIDGLTPLRLFAESHRPTFREDMYLLVEGISRLGVTALMTAERGNAPGNRDEHERFVFDTVISLSRTEHHRRVMRRLTIEKSRGQDFMTGSHAMTIESGQGIRVYRRAQAAPKPMTDQPTSTTRLPTGIDELDGMMQGGLYEGSITMVTGISGTGKTVAGVQFLYANIAAGRVGMLVSLDEHPQQLIRNAATLGFDLEPLLASGKLIICYESPLEVDLDVHFARVTELVEKHNVDCVVFDSVAVYEMAFPEEVADFLYAFANFIKGRLCTAYFNYESPELLGISQISEELKGSHLVDNIVLLNYVEISTCLRRAITVPKVRGSKNLQTTREFVIDQGGIEVLRDDSENREDMEVPQLPFAAYYGLLSRSPTRQSPVVEEAVAKGEGMPESVPAETPD